MKNNFSLKFNFFDILIASISLLIAISSMIYVNIKDNSTNGQRVLTVQYHNTIIKEIDLESIDEKTTIILKQEDYPQLFGDFPIEIDPDKGVRVIDVTCPNHTCEKYGYISKNGRSIVCIPNGIILTISSKEIDDAWVVG